jgi:NAD(P)H-quinone oxidoreductase subunit 2
VIADFPESLRFSSGGIDQADVVSAGAVDRMDVANLASQLNAGIILPEGIVVATLLVVLVGDLIAGRASTRWTPYATMGGLSLAIVALVYQWDAATPLSFLGSFIGDDLSIVFRGIIP